MIAGETWMSVMINESYNLEAFPFDMQWLEMEIEIPNALKIAPYKERPNRK